MKKLAATVGLLIAAFGVFGILAPARLLSTAQSWLSPLGLYSVAVARLLAGALLLGAARHTRAPTALRILGTIFILNGFVTAFMGLQRAEALLAWAATQSPMLTQAGAAIAFAVGVFVFYAASGPRRATPSEAAAPP